MLKALLRKQFQELKLFFLRSGKTGAKQKTSSKGMGVLLIVIALLLLFSFFSMAAAIGASLLGQGRDWLYFAFVGMISVLFGVLGTAFSTYTGLYLAKDNDLLLSMPIPPMTILLVRMISTFVISFVYTALIWVPGMAVYWMIVLPGFTGYLYPILLLLLLSLLVTTLSCALGYLVALIAVRIKNRSFVVVLLSLGFLGLYYFVYFRFMNQMEEALANLAQMGDRIKEAVYPAFVLGEAACGNTLFFLLTAAVCLALFALCCLILAKSFLRIATTNRGVVQKAYKEQKTERKGTGRALFGRELKHFLSSSIYMLNGGLGLLFMPVMAVAALVKRPELEAALAQASELLPAIPRLIPAGIAIVLMSVGSMMPISAPSVSLEGSTYWLIRSLPVPTWDVLKAKEALSFRLTILFALPSALLLGIAFRLSIVSLLAIFVFILVFSWFMADIGLMFNLKKPNLEWTNEAVPVKQGLSVLFAMLTSLFANLVFAALGFSLVPKIGSELYLLLISLLVGLGVFVLRRWLKGKGCAIFENL